MIKRYLIKDNQRFEIMIYNDDNEITITSTKCRFLEFVNRYQRSKEMMKIYPP